MKKIYFNGNVITVDQNETVAEAILIEDGKIKAVRTNDEILALDKEAERIDLNKKTVLPGFIDPHGHIAFSSNTPFGSFESGDTVLTTPPSGTM